MAFSSWLAECPWLGSGGTCVARLAGHCQGDQFVEAISRELFAWDQGQSSPWINVIYGDELKAGLERAMAQRFGVSDEASPWQTREALTRVLAERPPILVLTPPPSALPYDLYQEAESLRDQFSKSRHRSSLTWVLMDNAVNRLDGRLSFDLTLGRPAFGVFETRVHTEWALWSAYVHTRIAWESGGNAAIAADLDRFLSTRTATSDDGKLECALNAWSQARLGGVDPCDLAALDGFLSGSMADVKPLLEWGLLWALPGQPSAMPVPWTARAMLCRNPRHVHRWLLRSSLVCMPLATELLSLCQTLEQHVKSRMSSTGEVFPEPPEEIVDTWQRLCDGRDETTRYPDNHPAPPTLLDDVWTFASLGQFLHINMHLGRPPSTTEQSLNRLRNTLAHGHFAGWHQVNIMKRILDALGSR